MSICQIRLGYPTETKLSESLLRYKSSIAQLSHTVFSEHKHRFILHSCHSVLQWGFSSTWSLREPRHLSKASDCPNRLFNHYFICPSTQTKVWKRNYHVMNNIQRILNFYLILIVVLGQKYFLEVK